MSTIEKAVGKSGFASGDKKRDEEAGSVQRSTKALHPTDSFVDPEPAPQHVPEYETPSGDGLSRKLNIPLEALRRQGILTPNAPRSAIAEEYRTIKRPILRNIDGAGAAEIEYSNLVMVTSALEGDGKTFSSISLALSIAMELDKTVLFVDADVAKATAGRLLGVPHGSPGLIDLLETPGKNAGEVILPTNVDKLSVLPAGRPHQNSTELLASDNMRKIMIEISRRYTDRVVVFDSPPLLLTTEAAVLASFVGQIVFVVNAESTPQNAVVEAIEYLGPDKAVGIVLNSARPRHFGPFGFSYGYGYGYGANRREYGADSNATTVAGR